MALSVNNYYSALTNNSLSADSVASTASADQLTNQIQGANTDKEAMEACEQFESYLLEQMFKTMEESAKVFSDDEDEEGSEYVDMFSDNMYQTLAQNMVSNGSGLGIAKMLYESMERNGQISHADVAEAASTAVEAVNAATVTRTDTE